MRSSFTSLFQIRPGEGRSTLLLILVMLLLTMGGSIGSPGINALFFSRIGVEFLPYMFIALAGLTVLTTLALTALLGRLSKKRLYLMPYNGITFYCKTDTDSPLSIQVVEVPKIDKGPLDL